MDDSMFTINDGPVARKLWHERPWWQRGLIYQVYPRSFADSNGDGVGDLPGLASRLDYLAWLGVDAIWISPFYPSPMVDFGYDVSDHTNVDALFGTLEDFDAVVAHAHRLDIRVLIDFLPNHTSDQHPWFVASRSSRSNRRRDWYLWADPRSDGGPPNNWRSLFGGLAWTFDDQSGQYYYHAYLPEQPDLNWRNPEVRSAMFDVMRFWLRRGVDGFRLDGFRHLIKDELLRDNPPNPHYRPGDPPYDALLPTYTTDRPEIHEIVGAMRRLVGYMAERPNEEPVLLAELYVPIDRLVRYYGDQVCGLHLPSNMHLISTPYSAEHIAALVERYEAALPEWAWPNWVLGNHDRSRIATRVGRQQARAAAMLLLTLRGTPVLYYGDEIGMRDVPIPPERVRDPFEKNVPGIGVGRDPERSPMQWNGGANAGFCPPRSTPWLPVSPDHTCVNVASQAEDARSILNLVRSLIALRREHAALSVGSYRLMSVHGDALAYVRESDGERFAVAINLGERHHTLDASPVGSAPGPVGAVMISTHLDRRGEAIHDVLDLRPHEGLVVLLSKDAKDAQPRVA